MTISVSQRTSKDLFEDNDSLLFDRHRASEFSGTLPRIGAVTFVAVRRTPSQSLSDLALACGKEAMLLISRQRCDGLVPWLFVSDGPWKEASRIVLYRKLWRSHPRLVLEREHARMSGEVAIRKGDRVRFAGLLEVSHDMAANAIEMVRTDLACAMLFSNRADITSESSVRHLFSSAFPKLHGVEQTTIDWMALAIAACPQGDILMRVSGRFDDHEAAVDIIACEAYLTALS